MTHPSPRARMQARSLGFQLRGDPVSHDWSFERSKQICLQAFRQDGHALISQQASHTALQHASPPASNQHSQQPSQQHSQQVSKSTSHQAASQQAESQQAASQQLIESSFAKTWQQSATENTLADARSIVIMEVASIYWGTENAVYPKTPITTIPARYQPAVNC